MTERSEMEAVIEAILFVSNDPVARPKLIEVFGEEQKDLAEEALAAVIERYGHQPTSGLVLDEVAGGLRLVTRPELHGYLRRFFEVSGSNKLSMAALETLAIVAYRQPVTGPEIQELRGVSPQGVLKTLLERRLVRITGRKEVVGKPFLYGTTREFLLHFGLRSLKELPPLEQFEEMFGAEEAPDGEPVDAEEAADREALDLEEKVAAEAERIAQEEEDFAREEAELDAAAELAPPPGDAAEDADDPESDDPESQETESEETDDDPQDDEEEPGEGDTPEPDPVESSAADAEAPRSVPAAEDDPPPTSVEHDTPEATQEDTP